MAAPVDNGGGQLPRGGSAAELLPERGAAGAAGPGDAPPAGTAGSGGGAPGPAGGGGPAAWRVWGGRAAAFAQANFLPLCLALAVILGLAWPWLGQQVSAPEVSIDGNNYRVVPSILVLVIFLSSGLTLSTADIKKAAGEYIGAAYGIVSILFVTPLMGFAALAIPFVPQEYSYGLALFTVMPTTLTSAVTLVGSSGGNAALALLLTVSTNLLGIVTVPFMLQAILSSSAAKVAIDAANLLIKLCITILAPLVLGKLVRDLVRPVEAAMKVHKKKMSMLNNGCLATVVWLTISRSASAIVSQSAGSIFSILAAGVALHVAYLAFNGTALWLLRKVPCARLNWPEHMAVWVCTSEKTLPIAITVLSFLPEEQVGRHGLVAIPCIVSHLAQIFMDSFICGQWAQGRWRLGLEKPFKSPSEYAHRQGSAGGTELAGAAEQAAGASGTSV